MRVILKNLCQRTYARIVCYDYLRCPRESFVEKSLSFYEPRVFPGFWPLELSTLSMQTLSGCFRRTIIGYI